MHYKEHFKGKVVYSNCDDPRVSNFFHYFSHNFEKLNLKKLTATCYKNKEMDLFSKNDSEQAIYLEYFGDKNGNSVPDPEEIGIKYLEGDGDFRSEESIELLKEADIVVTNPPFSLFREYVAQLMEYGKTFLIIGNKNSITYKEMFKLIKENKVWLGHASPSDFLNANGNLSGKMTGLTRWFTNLDIPKRHEDLILYKTYNPEEYPTYDNYDAINVDKVKDIPLDYKGVIGVPITFLDKHNPEQFEIVGQGQGNLYRELTPRGLSAKFVEDYYKAEGKGSIKEDHPVLGYYKNGKATIPYMRILIKNKRL